MGYILVRILEMFTQPSNVLLGFSMVGAALLPWRRGSAWAVTLLLVGVGGLAACAILPVGTWLMRPLEDRFSQPQPMPAHVNGIILLGGAINLAESADRHMPALNIRAERMTAFAALARTYPHARLLFSGGNARLFSNGETEADVARKIFVSIGINPARMSFDAKSRNTHENAVFSFRLAKPKPGQVWLLVTSAADMPRAVGCFRAVGWPVIPFPVDYHTRSRGNPLFPGLVSGLQRTDWAVHEWLGLAYYWLRGWVPSLYPGPRKVDAGMRHGRSRRLLLTSHPSITSIARLRSV
ncbi:hypothetical protein BI364_11570 [Acidihalobacter yilgarnensis]|uniref:DUF218 domain-containing protein n=1 Tax=Acidihalobacter yilgarnensis TaxID=2819280 RepID=A0A1D8IQ05_9GAMM|nr:YdcF family protein [Acidihalobacter yilgarnensis]AOU98505.1 hypothetical protein BI364_11570 [Acidihalobacter yilgarnensis]